jgi:tRNA(fMet)-specific endonuclease VapC
MFALDTNTLISFFKGLGRAGENLLAQSPADIATPAVAIYELEAGIAQSRQPAERRDQLNSLLARTAVTPLELRPGRRAAEA